MTDSYESLVQKFQGIEVTVIGDVMVDCYVKGQVSKIAREAPVPVVEVGDEAYFGGAAANVAINLSALGAKVNLISVAGDDYYYCVLEQYLESNAVSTQEIILDKDRKTRIAKRVMVDSQVLLRLDEGSQQELSLETQNKVLEKLTKLKTNDIVIISDYAQGIFTPKIIEELSFLRTKHKWLLVVDSKNLRRYKNMNPSVVKPNWNETLALLGADLQDIDPLDRAEGICKYGEGILDFTGANIAAVTLDTEGAIVFEKQRPPYRTYAHPAKYSRSSGAGDTFLSAFTLSLASGGDMPAAAEIASLAAEVVVEKELTSFCSNLELKQKISKDTSVVLDLDYLRYQIKLHKDRGKKIIFTNGCFDLIHRGHIDLLNRAKQLGDILVVGVNDDQSVAALKGPTRPINTLEDRLSVLNALSCIDYIIPFSQNSPTEIITQIQPDFYIKGGNYTRENLPEVSLVESFGGQVKILPLSQDQSTSNIIGRIRSSFTQEYEEISPREVV